MFVVPSPKKQTATWPDLRYWARPRRAERDRQVGADDRVRAHHVVADVGDVHRAALAAHQPVRPAEQLRVERAHRRAARQRVVVAAVRRERVVVVAHRRGEAGRDRLLPDAEMGRSPDEALEEQLLGPRLEEAALLHRPVQREAGLRVGRHDRRHQYAFATNSSCGREAGDDLRPVRGDDDLLLDPGRREAVLRRAVRLEGDDHALLDLDRVVERVEAADDRALVEEQPDAVAELEAEALHLVVEAELLGLRPDARDLVGRRRPAASARSTRRSTRGPACRRRAGRRSPCRRRTSGSSRSCSRRRSG